MRMKKMTGDNKVVPVPFLKFPGGMLCPLEAEDSTLLYPAINDPTQRHYFDRTEPKQMSQQVEWIEGW